MIQVQSIRGDIKLKICCVWRISIFHCSIFKSITWTNISLIAFI